MDESIGWPEPISKQGHQHQGRLNWIMGKILLQSCNLGTAMFSLDAF